MSVRRVPVGVAVLAGAVPRRRLVKGEKVALSLVQANRDPAVFGAGANAYDPHPHDRLAATSRPYALEASNGCVAACVHIQ